MSHKRGFNAITCTESLTSTNTLLILVTLQDLCIKGIDGALKHDNIELLFP